MLSAGGSLDEEGSGEREGDEVGEGEGGGLRIGAVRDRCLNMVLAPGCGLYEYAVCAGDCAGGAEISMPRRAYKQGTRCVSRSR